MKTLIGIIAAAAVAVLAMLAMHSLGKPLTDDSPLASYLALVLTLIEIELRVRSPSAEASNGRSAF